MCFRQACVFRGLHAFPAQYKVQNTLGLENGFNDLRDGEIRSARHKTRSTTNMQATAILSVSKRYQNDVTVVEITTQAHAQVASSHVDTTVFEAEKSSLTAATLGLDPKGLMQGGFRTTAVDAFSRHSLTTLQVMLRAERAAWPFLWMANLMRAGMVVRDERSKECYYVVGTGDQCVHFLQLVEDGANKYRFRASFEVIKPCMPIADLAQYTAFDYRVWYQADAAGPAFGCELTFGLPLPEYVCRRTVHLLLVKTLRSLCKALAIKTRGLTKKGELVAKLMDHMEVPEEERDWILARLAATQKRKATKNPTAEEDAEEEEDEADVSEVKVPTALERTSPQEVAYMMEGGVAAGAALTEEETDEGMAVRAQQAAKVVGSPSRSAASTDPMPTTDEPEPADKEEKAKVPSVRAGDVAAWRLPADDQMVAPPGCSLRKYGVRGGKNPYWEARLPNGMLFGLPGEHPTNSRRRNFHEGFRTEASAKLECLTWLRKAELEGVLA